MPVMWITVQVALTDIESIEHGPTQYVPGSHYSGRTPNDLEDPVFDGVGPSRHSPRRAISICKTRCAGIAERRILQTARDICSNRSTPPMGLRAVQPVQPGAVADDDLRTASDQLLNLLGRPRPNGV